VSPSNRLTERILARVAAALLAYVSITLRVHGTYVMYRKPSSSLCSSYIELIRAAVGGSTSSTKMKMAFSGDSLMRLRIT
jgi:hypothetical protein